MIRNKVEGDLGTLSFSPNSYFHTWCGHPCTEIEQDEKGEPFTSTIVLINQMIDDAQKIQRSRVTRVENEDTTNNNKDENNIDNGIDSKN